MNVFPKTNTTYIGIRLPDELKERLRSEADKRKTTVTAVIRQLVEESLLPHGRKRKSA